MRRSGAASHRGKTYSVRIGHPGGRLEVRTRLDPVSNKPPMIESAVVGRTARVIMDGDGLPEIVIGSRVPAIAAQPMMNSEGSVPRGIEPYRQTSDDVLTALGVDSRSGLSQGEAQERLGRYGRNELATEKPVPAWRKFIAQFTDVLVILLLVAAAISAGLWLYERDSALPYEAMAIFAIVILNALMGHVQQARAENALAALRRMSAAHATVIRAGARQSILATELVPGDIILVEGGDTVPADARLLQSTALQTAEAALTGESLPVAKDIARDRGGSGVGRPAQHDLQWDGCDLRARPRGRHGDGDANRNRPHRRAAEGRN